MPIFDYSCRSCSAAFELLQLAGREAKAECPSCGSADVSQRIGVFAAHGSPSGGAASGGAGDCGRCGNEPGSCGRGG
jgi:putative FmdB family regulatory protein